MKANFILDCVIINNPYTRIIVSMDSANERRRYFVMPPSHCREFCLRTNTNWHSLRISQHRIDSNYFVLVRCHFRISSQANTNVLKCSKHSYWPCESNHILLRRIASPNVVSIRVSSYWFVSHRCTFVSIRCTFALGFAACLLRLSTLQYDAQRSPTVPTDPFMSHLATQLGYSAGEFQALQLIVLATFGVVD